MITANRRETFSSDIEKIWNTVTSCTEYSWRSDISKIEVVEKGRKFIEYTKNGYPTYFTITVFEPYKRYEFDLENGNMTGHWTGVFSNENGKVTVDFTEDVNPKKIFMRPFAGTYLKKQQELYMKDLKKALGE